MVAFDKPSLSEPAAPPRPSPWPRVRRWLVAAGAALALLAAALIGVRFLLHRAVADPELLRELAVAPLAPAAPVETTTDWPQWRGPLRDGLSRETGLLTDWPADGPKKLWSAPASVGYSCFAIARGRAFTILQDGEHEAVVCWDAASGKELWRFKYPARYVNDWGSGPRSTPTVDGELVFTVGATGIMNCLKADSGDKVWQRDLLDDFSASNLTWGVSFSPLVEGDLVFVNPGGEQGNSIAALDKRTGRTVWKCRDDVAGYSSPVAATLAGVRQVLFFTGDGLVSVAPADGTVYWFHEWKTDYDCNIATPIVVGDYVFISSGYGRGCALFKVESAGGKLTARRVYENTSMCNHFASCVYYNEHLYGFNDNTLTCMEFRTGKVLWKERGFQKGALTIADGHLIILGQNGKLALAEASPAAYREKASWKFSSNKCWTVPVFSNGRLYLRDEETILCLDLRKR